jgi:hypothetical protein
MGVDIVTWRSRVGYFSGHTSRRGKFTIPAILVRGQIARATLRLTLLAFTLLVVAGDIESHPGPNGGERGTSKGYTQSQLPFRDNANAERRVTRNSPFAEARSGHKEPDKLDRILDRLDGIGQQMFDIDQKLDREIKLVNERLDVYDDRCAELESQNAVLFDKLSHLEDQSRRDNLIFWGVPEKEGAESWSDCEQTVRSILCDTFKIDSADNDSVVSIERAHRLNGTGHGGKPRGIIVKFGRFKHKQQVTEKARQSKSPDISIRVCDDNSASVRATRNKLRPHIVRMRADYPDKKVFLRYDKLVVDQTVYVPDGDDIQELGRGGRRR